MKIVIKIMFALLVCLPLGCSKNSDTQEATDRTGDLTGLWQPVAYSITGNRTIIEFDEATVSTFEGIGAEFNYTLAFSENPNTFTSQGDFILTLTITNENGTFVTGSNEFIAENGSWIKAGNSITFTEGSEVCNATISELTANTLRYSRNKEVNTVDGNSSVNTSTLEQFTFFRVN